MVVLSKSLRTVVPISTAMAITAAAAAQGSGNPCTPPAPTGCVAWTHIGRSYDVIIDLDTYSYTIATKVGDWIETDAYFCSSAPCSTRPVAPPPPSETRTEANQWCVSVKAGVSVQSKIALANALIGEIGFTGTVTLDVTGTYCVTWTEAQTIYGLVSECWRTFVRPVWTVERVEGIVREAAVVDYWDCERSNGLIVVVGTHCGVRQSTGYAFENGAWGTQTAPPPPNCGGPNPTPPQYGGKTMIPCCAHVDGCEPLPPEGQGFCCPCRQGH